MLKTWIWHLSQYFFLSTWQELSKISDQGLSHCLSPENLSWETLGTLRCSVHKACAELAKIARNVSSLLRSKCTAILPLNHVCLKLLMLWQLLRYHFTRHSWKPRRKGLGGEKGIHFPIIKYLSKGEAQMRPHKQVLERRSCPHLSTEIRVIDFETRY